MFRTLMLTLTLALLAAIAGSSSARADGDDPGYVQVRTTGTSFTIKG